MDRLIKENILYIIIVIAGFFCGLYGVYTFGTNAYNSYSDNVQKTSELENIQQKLEQLKTQKANEAKSEKKKSGSGKVIYEVLAQQFSPEASFGIMFENLLANITNNGVRIRSIDYNYSPNDDKVLLANAPGYNACELSFITVSNYAQLQNFFKSIAKETYLSNVYEVYIEPYDKDKTILIAKFKIRLYTRTI